MSMLEKAFDSPNTQFLENRPQTPSLTLKIIGPNSPVERFLERPNEKLRIVRELSVLMSQLHK